MAGNGTVCSQKEVVSLVLGRSEKSILTLRIIFRVKIYVNIYIEPRNEVKILKKWVLGISISTQKLARPPLRRKKKYSRI